MPEKYVPEDQSAFLSFLDWMTGGGRTVRALGAGDTAGAGRQLQDMLLDIPDALLPGDVFKKKARPEDDHDFGELLNMADGPAKTIASAVGNVLTDPVTYIPGAKLLKGAKAGLSAVEKHVPGAALGLRKLRDVSGNPRLSKDKKTLVSVAGGKEAATQKNWAVHAEDKLAKYDDKTRHVVSDVIENTTGSKPGEFKILDESHKPVSRYAANDRQITEALKRAKLHPDYTPDMDAAIKDYMSSSQGMYAQIGKMNAWEMPETLSKHRQTRELATNDEALKLGWKDAESVPFDPETMSPRDYLMRIVESPDTAGKLTNPLKERHLGNAQELVDFLNDPKNQVSRYERDALKRFAGRIPAQGKIARRQALGEEVVGPGFKSGHRPDQLEATVDHVGAKQFTDALDDHVKSGRMTGEESDTLKGLYQGFGDSAPKGAVLKALDVGNKWFKQAAVYGIGIPRVASILRNRLSTGFQTLGADGATGAQAATQFKNFASDVWSAAVHDGLGLNMPKNQLRQHLDTLDAALKGSNGRVENAVATLRKGSNLVTHRLADALELGVVDSGFVTGEELAKDLAEAQKRKFTQFPQRWFSGTEQRARLALFLDKTNEAGVSSMEAAQRVKSVQNAAMETSDTLYNYNYLTKANKTARQWLPFAQFTFQAIPREGKKLVKNPWLIPAAAQVYGTDDENVVPQWMAEQAHIPLGDSQYLMGLGEPMAALNKIPNLTGGQAGDEVRKVLSNMQPLAKTAFAASSGHDLYSDQPFGSYNRLPLQKEGSEAGSLYRMAEGTGFIQPLATPLNMLDTLMGESADRTTGSRVAQTLLGPHVRKVDEDKVRKDGLIKRLKTEKGVAEYSRLYATDSATPEVDALIGELDQMEKARKQKAAQAAAGSVR